MTDLSCPGHAGGFSAVKMSWVQCAIRYACVAWPLGNEEWPGTGIGGNSAGATCDGRIRLNCHFQYIATNRPTTLAICRSRYVFGCDDGVIDSTAMNSPMMSSDWPRISPSA